MATVERLSHSSLEDVRSCSMKYKLRKVDRVPSRTGWSLIGGNAVHEVTAKLDERDFGKPVESADLDFTATFDRLIAKGLEENPEFPKADWYCAGRRSAANPNKEDEKWWRENGPLMVDRWVNFKRVTPWNIWLTPQAEPAIELELQAEYGGVPVKGYLDRIMELPDGSLCVLDIKTGSTEPKSNGQLGQYADMTAKLLGEEYRPRWGCYWMARTGSLTPPVDLAPLAKGLDHDYRTAARIIALDLFLTSPSNLCGSCSVNAHCPSFSPNVST
jgi:putative RecB family exonuclease